MTRWVERHDAILHQFTSDLPQTIHVMEKRGEWKNRETSSKASILATALRNSDFIVGVFCLGDVLSIVNASIQRDFAEKNFGFNGSV